MAGKIIADTIESAGSQISLNVGNVTVLTASSSSLALKTGSATAPGLTFSGYPTTGLYSPAANTIAFSTAGTEYMRIDSSGNVGIGTNSPDYKLTIQNTDAAISLKDSAGTTRAYIGVGGVVGTAPTGALRLRSDQGGLVYAYAGAEQMRIDTSGNVLVTNAGGGLGYGTGSGGMVTQATSKATAVTLNKPSGRITMVASALAAATTVEFTFNNSLIDSGDMVVITITGNVATAAAYNVGTRSLAGGSIIVGIRNVTTGSLSEAIQLTFALIKGSES